MKMADDRIPITLTLNGRERRLLVAPHHTLLEVLRDDAGATGTKECCAEGECGACTVLFDGRAVDSCLVLGVEADGHAVVTVEGLAKGATLSAVQQAFLDAGAVQCGFCIPGMLVAATDLLARIPNPTAAQIQEGLAGNLCRCAGYSRIVDAVLRAARGSSGAQHPTRA